MTAGERDAWTEYLDALVERPGWSVSRLAKESGVHRATIYRWLKGDIKNVTIESVRAIARGGQGSLAAALHAARAHTQAEPVDAADDDDFEAHAIRESAISDDAKQDLLAHLANRRRQLAEEVNMLIKSAERD